MAAPSTVEDYLAACPPAARAALEHLRALIKAVAPEATEVISYQMPGFRAHGRMLVWYAAFKDHCSFYPGNSRLIETHRERLQGFPVAKGTIRFHPERPLPDDLVREIVRARLEENASRSRR